ncbi:PiggyBac transposable element-derived protein 4 [Eumeta japonica]|uniref:PiggyBac transposable element-derived protein 4 n=1 Tax=Eumeta variegata TaxID=151549 RepID=A0A4C1WHL8_EUMVA|nr:PiggyBac transposable element-derived protein 4 [Eumeta japonica]
MVNVPATTYCGLGAERIGPITAISRSCAIPSPAIPDRSSAQPSPSSSTSSPQFKRPKTVKRPVACSSAVYRHFAGTQNTDVDIDLRKRCAGLHQPKNQAQADSEWGVDDVEECTSGTKKLLMELGINKLGKPEILYVIEIEDTEHDIMSQVSNLVAPFLASIQPASTHQVITFPDVHVSADEDMPSSSRTFRVSSPTEALLDPESGSSYDDSEFSDDDDAEYLVTSKRRFSRIYQTMRSYHLRPDRENYKIVLNLLEGLEHKGHCVTMDNYYNSPALARYLKCRGFDCLGTERLTRKNIPEDVKEMKKNCEKGTIIACHPAM